MTLELIEFINNYLPQGFVPYYIYGIMLNHQEIGRLTLRVGTDEECYLDGHIGYHIEEAYRGHHYSYQACLLLKEKIDQDHLLITCSPNNYASLKTIKKLGCQYLETKVIPNHLKKLFAENESEKMIFRWNITS